jgi:hypothetical protein
VSLPFSERADRSHTRDRQPKQKETEKQSNNCAHKTVNKPDESGFLLGSSLKQDRSYAAYQRICGEGEYRAAQNRQNGVRHFAKRPRHRDKQAASEKRSRIGGTKGDKTYDLTHQTESPPPHDFE